MLHPFGAGSDAAVEIHYHLLHSDQRGTVVVDLISSAAAVKQIILDASACQHKEDVRAEDMTLSLGQAEIQGTQSLQDAGVATGASLSLKVDVEAVDLRREERQKKVAAELRRQRGKPNANERTCSICGEHKTAEHYDKKAWSQSRRVCEECHEKERLQSKVRHEATKDFKTMDSDKNGQLNREEWIARFGDDEEFDRFDVNGNGVVQLAEYLKVKQERLEAELHRAEQEPSCAYRWLCCLCYASQVAGSTVGTDWEKHGIDSNKIGAGQEAAALKYETKMKQVRTHMGPGEHCVTTTDGRRVDVRAQYEAREDAMLAAEGKRLGYTGDYVNETKSRRQSYSAADASGMLARMR